VRLASCPRLALRLCLVGVSFAAAFTVIGFLTGGPAASASERDTENGVSQGQAVAPIGSLISPVVDRDAAPDAAVDQRVDSVTAPVVAAAPKAAAAIGGPVSAVAAAPLITEVIAPVVELAEAPVFGGVPSSGVVPSGSAPDALLTSLSDTLTDAGVASPLTVQPTAPGGAPGGSDGNSASNAVTIRLLSPVRSGLMLHSGGFPPPVPFGGLADGPAVPAVPAGQASGGNTGGGGGPCPADLPGTSAPLLLPGSRQVAPGDDSAPVSPAFEPGSTPG
jgi:hypothetical protein